jgi:NitT/TauT family transport system ATP-binding protein
MPVRRPRVCTGMCTGVCTPGDLENTPQKAPRGMTTSPHMIELREVSHVYTTQAGPLPVLDNLTIEIPENTFCAVVGPSGCGKSTLTRLVSGLMKPTEGQVWLHSQLVKSPRPTVGMAFQNPVLLEWRTILDNVLLPMEIVKSQMTKAEATERARHLLDLVGLTGFEDKRPSELSGGMRQRASLCRSIIHKPDVLILDEPFGALDAFTREDLWCTMHDLREEEPFTCLLITHDLRESVFLADQVVVLSGRPAHTQYVLDVDMPAKRQLDDLYTPKAVEMLAILRHQIQVAQGRAEDGSEPLAEHAPPASAARRPIPGAMQ